MQKLQSDFSTNKPVDLAMHDLTIEQQQRQEKIKNKFICFEKHGLGRTTIEKQSIQLIPDATPVKDKHYPLSPAVQQLVYDEVDEMLRLGVIEESESPWSNRTTVVWKLGKIGFA